MKFNIKIRLTIISVKSLSSLSFNVEIFKFLHSCCSLIGILVENLRNKYTWKLFKSFDSNSCWLN
ncbi:hypothetical protein DERP_007283 [Dermatophagoides pteronyssinus]|uniref:Uncharacterized protein n=1 Tax=Dermatophagoides pteronyssinus TaxID=6956 RepID=A0ABQ8J420_DERPT|nr:hypothetical protein DERP_007283 [Dermatophagoides pteronyssinus]